MLFKYINSRISTLNRGEERKKGKKGREGKGGKKREGKGKKQHIRSPLSNPQPTADDLTFFFKEGRRKEKVIQLGGMTG